MPNRIIKESICTSEDLDKLSPMAEILFYRLIVKADDYGAYYGNESIVKSTCFPLKSDEIKCDQVKSWIMELASAGLIYVYEAEDGRKYIQFVKWSKHQQVRAKKSKFPQFGSSCNQLIADVSKCPRNPIQSNTNPIQSESNEKAQPSDNENDLSRVMNFYFDRVNPTPSPMSIDELKHYTASLGADVVLHALGIALDERKTGWSYIRGILSRYERDGLKNMNAVLDAEQRHRDKKEQKPKQEDNYIAPFTPKEKRHDPYDLSDMVEWPPGSNHYIPSREVPKDGG